MSHPEEQLCLLEHKESNRWCDIYGSGFSDLRNIALKVLKIRDRDLESFADVVECEMTRRPSSADSH